MTGCDPNAASAPDDGLFGLWFDVTESAVVIVPVPWDATSSQGRTSGDAPDTVYAASKYVELYDPKLGPIYRRGIALDAAHPAISTLNRSAVALREENSFQADQLTEPCEAMNRIVLNQVSTHLSDGRNVGLLGGDHSVSYGAIEAHVNNFPGLGVLQIDAHCDLRKAYDGIQYSHASIMYNVVENLRPRSLVQVGVRGLCDFEADYVQGSSLVHTFFDADLYAHRAAGRSWQNLCLEIVAPLPDIVYVSLDIDGLTPSSCPNTGTSVPGGLTYNDVLYLLHQVRESGKTIVGFDLVEVGSIDYDANIAAHLLYQLCGLVGD